VCVHRFQQFVYFAYGLVDVPPKATIAVPRSVIVLQDISRRADFILSRISPLGTCYLCYFLLFSSPFPSVGECIVLTSDVTNPQRARSLALLAFCATVSFVDLPFSWRAHFTPFPTSLCNTLVLTQTYHNASTLQSCTVFVPNRH